MSKPEDLRNQAVRVRSLSQTVSDDQSAKTLIAIVQKYEDDANLLELSDRPADGANRKPDPPDGCVRDRASD
jgi:hypothetical protein